MPPNQQNDSLITIKRLASNDDYYNIVFKKTERIASAVFYILSHTELTDRTKVHYERVSDTAMQLHTTVIATLDLYEYEATTKLHSLQTALIGLQSVLRLAVSAGLFTTDIETIVGEEVDLVMRYIRNHYVSPDGHTARNLSAAPTPKPPRSTTPRRVRPNIPLNDFSSDAVLVYSDLTSRTSRIKTVLDAKPEATIKDLSDIITDVSTKTIQRDLNSLIDSGEVIRQGERRWSKYTLVK